MMINRRKAFLALLAVSGLLQAPPLALADDDGNDGGGDDRNSGDSSGHGSGHDDNDDSGKDSSSGKGSGEKDDDKNDDHDSEQDRARDAVRDGKAVSLAKLKAHVAKTYPGKVISINLQRSLVRYVYRVKILDPKNRLKLVRLDALTLRRL